jgi:hypothetical protein
LGDALFQELLGPARMPQRARLPPLVSESIRNCGAA